MRREAVSPKPFRRKRFHLLFAPTFVAGLAFLSLNMVRVADSSAPDPTSTDDTSERGEFIGAFESDSRGLFLSKNWARDDEEAEAEPT
jgi:hypothetical protein